MGVPIIGVINGRKQYLRDWNIHHEEAEHGSAVYCDVNDSVPLLTVHSEARGEGVPEVVGTRRYIFVGRKEEGSSSGRIGQRGYDSKGGFYAPRKDNRPVIMAGLQSSNLT